MRQLKLNDITLNEGVLDILRGGLGATGGDTKSRGHKIGQSLRMFGQGALGKKTDVAGGEDSLSSILGRGTRKAVGLGARGAIKGAQLGAKGIAKGATSNLAKQAGSGAKNLVRRAGSGIKGAAIRGADFAKKEFSKQMKTPNNVMAATNNVTSKVMQDSGRKAVNKAHNQRVKNSIAQHKLKSKDTSDYAPGTTFTKEIPVSNKTSSPITVTRGGKSRKVTKASQEATPLKAKGRKKPSPGTSFSQDEES